MDTSFNFLLQSSRIIERGIYDVNELNVIYEFLISLDNLTLIDYFNSNNVITYENDLEVYIEMINIILDLLIEKEEYEKCHQLKLKIDASFVIKNRKKINYG